MLAGWPQRSMYLRLAYTAQIESPILRPTSSLSVGVARAQRHVHVALGQVEVLVAHHKLDPQPGMAGMKAIEQIRLRDAVDEGFRPGNADHADHITPHRLDLMLELLHRITDGAGLGQQAFAKLGQTVARGVPLDQRLPDASLEFGEPALHGRLVDLQGLGGGHRAAMAGYGEENLEVVPVEHRSVGLLAMQLRGGLAAGLRVTPHALGL